MKNTETSPNQYTNFVFSVYIDTLKPSNLRRLVATFI